MQTLDDVRTCIVCDKTKKTNPILKLSDFRKNTGKKADGTHYFRRTCKPCENTKLHDKRKSLTEFSRSSNDKLVIKATKNLQAVKIRWNAIQKELRKAERDLEGLKRGLKYVESSPLVRSSYHAERHAKVPY